MSFSTRNAIAKLAQVYGLSKKARIRLEVLDFALAPSRGRHLREIGMSRSLLSVEGKAKPQKPQKPGRIGPEDPRRSKSPVDPEAWRRCKDSGRNSRFSEREAFRPPQERGFHCFFLHRGEHPQVSQNPGAFEGEKPRKVSAPKSPRGNQRPRVMRKP